MEAGLDSIGAVELRSLLGTAFGTELPATLTFDYPTTAALAGYLAARTRTLPDEARSAGTALHTVQSSSLAHCCVSIVH